MGFTEASLWLASGCFLNVPPWAFPLCLNPIPGLPSCVYPDCLFYVTHQAGSEPNELVLISLPFEESYLRRQSHSEACGVSPSANEFG